jgi:lipopolysaccharide export system protein LptA
MSRLLSIDDMLRFGGALLIVLVLSAGLLYAEERRKIKGPVVITAETLTANNKERTALFEKSVVAKSEDITIHADKMLVLYDKDTGNVTRIDAEGSVKVIRENSIITSREAVYFADEEKVVFTGDPRAVQDENVVTGKKMTYLMNEDRFLVEDSKVFLKNTQE